MIHTILQIVFFQAIFLAVYDVFFKKETFFNWNRAYLLVTPWLAILIPLIKIPVISNETALRYAQITLPELFLNLEKTSSESTISPIDYGIIILGIGMGIALLIFLVKLIQIYRLISQNQTVKKENYTLVLLSDSRQAFSFLNYIFIDKKLLEKESLQIIEHELVHCKSKHSIDLLIFEFLKIVLWFNPIIYMFQHRMQLLHEYIADSKTIKKTTKEHYFNQLLSEVFKVESLSFINQFYKSSFLKKRIIMATKNKSKQVKKVKYLLVIPMIFLMLFYTSCADSKKENIENKEIAKVEEVKKTNELAKKNAPISKEEKDVVPFAIVKKAPIFPNCKGNEQELKKCLERKVAEHISKNFDTKLANSLGLKKGVRRVMAMFEITKDGTIRNIRCRAPHKTLEEETIRVIKLLPKMTPAEDGKGGKVNVKYALPIKFMVVE